LKILTIKQQLFAMNPSDKERYPFPIFLNVSDRNCVVIGGGKVALRKINDLIEAGALITVIAVEPLPEIENLSGSGEVKLLKRRFKPGDLDDAFLVFAATNDKTLNVKISEAAKQRGILVNVVDNPELCNFFSGAVVKRGPLRLAVSTSGRCPSIAAGIRKELEELYTESYGDFVQSAGELRDKILSVQDITDEKKQQALKWLSQKETFTLFLNYGKEKVWEKLKKIIYT